MTISLTTLQSSYLGLTILAKASKLFNKNLVGSSGLEPPTSRLSGARSNHLSYEPIFRSQPGGDDGIRTHDPLLAGQVLSQLSYTPVKFPFTEWFGEFLSELSVSALTYFPGTLPSKYLRHSTA